MLSAADLVDLAAHPISDLSSAAGQSLIDRCKRQLDSQGFVRLPGFLRAAAAARLADEALSLEQDPIVARGAPREVGFYSTERHNIFLREESHDEQRHARHPQQVQQTSSKVLAVGGTSHPHCHRRPTPPHLPAFRSRQCAGSCCSRLTN